MNGLGPAASGPEPAASGPGPAASGPEPDGAAPGAPYDIVAIAASAGGITALGRVLGGLPAGFPVPVVVVQHLDPRHQTIIADVLGRRAKLPVQLAREGERAKAGTIYVAPPNHHLLVGPNGTLTLSSSELVHFVRPSADLLFESVAGTYGARAIACILTGSGSDGAMGASAVKSRGGTVIVEDPELAEFKGMPEAVVSSGAADFVLPLDEVASVIRGLVEARAS
ncbi:MAG TPA: chemotaxis protein CheB [Streptosporangiaceae bacterium]|nr:chemotaxis protein CheB [Streptosporangiaceae bacterium]